MSSPTITALILAGGKSSRMGSDKSQLVLHDDGLTQTERLQKILSGLGIDSYLSTAHGTPAIPRTLPDLAHDRGPLAGLEAAFAHDPDTHWLVIACDLPLLDADTISHLIAAGTGTRAYRNRLDGRAEPLCAIYDPARSTEPLTNWLAEQKRCARHFLESLEPQLHDLPSPHALDNANTPEDLIELRTHLDGTATMKSVSILLFAKLQDDAGTAQLTHESDATTAAAIYDECRMKHSLSLKRQHLRVAINGDFADWATKVKDGDELAFLPPVSGG